MEQTNYYLCMTPNTWGKGASEQEAKRNANLYSSSKPHKLYLFSHDQFQVDQIDGEISYQGEAPTIVK